jgi:hypothetical protein
VSPFWIEAKASLAQSGIFVVGLVLSIAGGMFLCAHLDGAMGLLISTVAAGAGLLGGAVLSQVVHDHIVTAEPDPAPSEANRSRPQRAD